MEVRSNRRDFLVAGAATAGALAFGPGFWQQALAAPAAPGPGPYGPLGPPDANGLRLPAGFSAREIARAHQPVPGTTYPWHVFPDGQATFALADGGWVLVSNSESIAPTGAGSSAIRFRPDGSIAAAYRILAGTNVNCAGGPTPFGTWLSCEEFEGGQVWECDPLGVRPAQLRPGLGVFSHEAACVDPAGKRVYLTEDEGDGGFYRFTPELYPDLASGLLEVAVVAGDGSVSWAPVPDPSAITGPTRQQVAEMTRFRRGEGIWFDSGFVYVVTTGDNKVHAYDTCAGRIEVVYEGAEGAGAPIHRPDNITVARSGDLYVCEDNSQEAFEIGIITPEREVAPFVEAGGPIHNPSTPEFEGSEFCGVVFDPAGERMYFSSQRAHAAGAVYEVTGPFRAAASGATVGSRPLDGGPCGDVATIEDADEPGLRVRAVRRASLAGLIRRGVLVEVTVDRPGRVRLALRTAELRRERDPERPGTERPRLDTLARATRSFNRPGRYDVRLRPARRARRRLQRLRRRLRARHARGRPRHERELAARIAVQLTDRNGRNAVASRAIQLGRPRPVRRRRRRPPRP